MRRSGRLLVSVLLASMPVCLLASTPAWPAPAAHSPKASDEHLREVCRKAFAALDPYEAGGSGLDQAPQIPALLRRAWLALADWVTSGLDAEPAAGEASIAARIEELGADLDADVLRLGPRGFVVAATRGTGMVGAVFLVEGPPFAVTWWLGEGDTGGSRLLRAWSVAASGSCPFGLQPEHCGPVYASGDGSLLGLPEGARGASRFAVWGTYAQAAGGTVGHLLSLHEWRPGAPPRLLFVDAYAAGLADTPRLDGGLLRIPVKDWWATMHACGSCEGRAREWTLRLAPDRVVDLGRRSLVPELDVIDDLFARVHGRQPTEALASPAASTAAKEIVAALTRDRLANSEDPSFVLGMMQDARVTGTDAERTVCISADAAFTATLERRGEAWFVTALQRLVEREDEAAPCVGEGHSR